MKQVKQFGALILVVVIALGLISCKEKSLKNQLVGAWYLNGETTLNRDGAEGPAFTLYDDGTCIIASEYGTGTWFVVNENQLKLTNFYGESSIATIESIENGRLTLDKGVYWSAPK